MITEYHGHGSLQDYLKNHTVTSVELLRIIRGLASALNHLHTEIIGSSRKPCITHNNINSKNILVKKDKQCCFGDFSKSIQFCSSNNNMNVPKDYQNTDIRYLAPEFLDKTFNPNIIETFKMGDVYSFALVLWEILSRCEIPSLISGTKYQVLFEEELNAENLEFSWDSMTTLVANKKIRPRLRSEWEQDPVLKMVTKVLIECWNATPSVRLTSLRIKKTFFKTQAENSG